MQTKHVDVPQLHVIVNSYSLAVDAIAANAPAIQVRIKNKNDATVLAECLKILAHVSKINSTQIHTTTTTTTTTMPTKVIVNDRADIAVACDADGVHVGAEDLPLTAVRKVVGTKLVVGATARDANTARKRQDEGASYLGVGPIYPTGSKAGLPPPIGVAGLAKIVAAVEIPIIAIAGITKEHIPEVLDAGAHGVAVLGVVASAASPAQATAELLKVCKDWTANGR